MSLEVPTIQMLRDAADYLSGEGFTAWASAIDAAILLNADMPNAAKRAKSDGYQAALSHDCDGEDYAV
jgi:hypothetical protein